MEQLVVNGGVSLEGEVVTSGAKNSSVAILPAALMAGSPVTIENLPLIDDIITLKELIQFLGAEVQTNGYGSLTVDPQKANSFEAPYELVSKLRASYYFLGSLLTRFKKAIIPLPGGCPLGPRPMDQHIKGFQALGARVEIRHGCIHMEAEQLNGTEIYLDIVSVGATINLMLASVTAQGKTILENVAKEPEIVDIANFLNAMGADIVGAGTDVIKITGVKKLGGTNHMVIPDRIEAGTFILAAASTNSSVLVKEVIPKHLEAVTAKLKELGVDLDVGEDWIHVNGCSCPKPISIKTFPYPGFPTDLQSVIMPIMTKAKGPSMITENVFEARYKHVDELKRMGANILVEGRTAIIEGGESLSGAPVRATDLRAGAGLIIAGLMAKGETIISGVDHIDRGYENIEEKFNKLGAGIKRITEE
ncbi:UDP-N-acetylglucosamine 1-carboxyvinyltransferase [Candidatus Contubernalis alkaliaceticus]|uniref:UDP-N-acetylglucosamine 1-carboxyvinyltransferase n=1 Tax=Candidatus Contubernalis alkaliaceticus TaxID=338645 RepID=UPI001F4BF886|nr:UDP-N-acetylglucosamine 1-carboxyvinyltransferase [Candidatus Contubernalis alkalaceticus]UNC93701.1 UDP-N-acetylglucosamine 1-carboxyvinyltransferase [Candidatus Contubernalis alkalaceticus]